MASNEEKRNKGFIDVDLYGIEDDAVYGFCMENRLIANDIYRDVESVMYSKSKTPIVIKDVKLLGKEWEYWLFKIGTKRDIYLIEGEYPEWIKRFSELEKAYNREMVKRGKDAKGKDGGYLGGYVPYGYYVAKKKLLIDDYESFVVKFVYYRRSQGCAISGITKELNLRGFRNRQGKEFSPGSIENILKNKRFYQGYTTYDGEEIKGKYKGILEDSLELLTEEWKRNVFDAETEAKIARQREKHHGDISVPHEIRPYIIVGNEPKKKGRRVK